MGSCVRGCNPVILYSVSKDSVVMVHMAKKAFYPSFPLFQLMHVEPTWKFQDMYKLRDKASNDAEMEFILHQNPETKEKGSKLFDHCGIHADMWTTESSKPLLGFHK